MRRALSAIVLFSAVAASVATSKKLPTTTSTTFRAPSTDLDARLQESFTLDLLATQSPAGSFDGAVMVTATATASGPATVTATLSVLDGSGATTLAHDTVVLSGGEGDLFLYDDLGALSGCDDGTACDQSFQLVLHTTGDVSVDWSFDADLYDLEDIGRTGELSVHLR